MTPTAAPRTQPSIHGYALRVRNLDRDLYADHHLHARPPCQPDAHCVRNCDIRPRLYLPLVLR